MFLKDIQISLIEDANTSIGTIGSDLIETLKKNYGKYSAVPCLTWIFRPGQLRFRTDPSRHLRADSVPDTVRRNAGRELRPFLRLPAQKNIQQNMERSNSFLRGLPP